MAYTPKTWQCGETIMADDLNHMEQGIAQGGGSEPLFVGMRTVDSDTALDKTWQEIYDAMNANRPAYVVNRHTDGVGYGIAAMPIISTEFGGSVYMVTFLAPGGSGNAFCTTSANGYPSYNGCQVS